MRRLLGLLLPLLLVAGACSDDDTNADEGAGADATPTTAASDDPATTGPDAAPDDDDEDDDDADGEGDDGPVEAPPAPPSSVDTDSPAGEGPGGLEDDDGLGDALLVADLGPDTEVPGPGQAGATGRFEAELVDGVLCLDMAVRGLGAAVTGAHVHEGGAGTAGPVLVDLGAPSATTAEGPTWTDACTEVGDDAIERLAGAPGQHYVNVHTSAFPDGAVRGQLSVVSVFDRTLG